MDAGSGIALAARADDLQILHLLAVFKGDVIHLTVAADVDFHASRQGVNHGDPHAVQTTRELVVLLENLPPA